MAWGGPEEQEQEIAAGNKNAVNWHDEALQVVEKTMQEYWDETTPGTGANNATLVSDRTVPTEDASRHVPAPLGGTLESEYDRHRRRLIEQANRNTSMGWANELRRYLTELPNNVSKDMDVVSWWSKHASIYPTLSRIAQDVCAIPASSVPCERLFSAGAEIATDRRSRLGSVRFEELQVLKHAWRNLVVDQAAVNLQDVQEVYMQEYRELYELEEERGDVAERGVEVVEDGRAYALQDS
ncbi:hypothetical protein SCLCIDRAFT_128426 [Scleroderma citrinum Foug A]|uniref:HAT C-terminal dimerisation domain-containing protein n=1 Tax=Scleroderma citrinum Foug A TaxID=1036808 RepID=A0A0C2Z8W1_9AGAM|nr:hypothetical protein SCLCIDRAFT_128426 [Scleroderma citrinum Foug A]